MENAEAKATPKKPAAEGEVVKSTSTSTTSNADMMAIASLVIGVINLCAWFIACCGFIFGILGIVLGVLGKKSEKYSKYALVGMILSGIGLVLAVLNSILGVAFNLGDFKF